MKDRDKLRYIFTICVFGTVGIFRRYIGASSTFVALGRGFIAVVFLAVSALITKRPMKLNVSRKVLFTILLCGACIGANWILLFEAYTYTTIATATLCYNMQPVFVILLSPLIFRDKLPKKKIICVLIALLGMVFVSGLLETGISDLSEFRGVLCGLGSAVLYACVVLISKSLPKVDAYVKTTYQLAVATVITAAYFLLTESVADVRPDTLSLIMLLILGVFHTGFTYQMYFSSLDGVSAQTAAILSYLDPVVAIILSAIILGEKMSVFGAVGAVLIIGALVISEVELKNNADKPV